MSGYFKIERDFLSSPFWLSEVFTKPQAWIDLIGMANYTDKTKFYKGVFQKVKRGQIITSQQALANRWNWSRHRVSDFLRTLEAAEMVTTERTTYGTLLTVVNYGFYQDGGSAKGTTKGGRKDTAGTSDGHQTDIQEESKERKKERRERAASAAMVSPSLEEVISYQEESGIDVDPEAFWDYYEGNGWMRGDSPIRNWKAVMRGWVGKPVYRESRPAGGIDLDKLQLTEAFYDPE